VKRLIRAVILQGRAGRHFRHRGAVRGSIQPVLSRRQSIRRHIEDKRLCDTAIKFHLTITSMDNDAAQRIVPYLAMAAAAG